MRGTVSPQLRSVASSDIAFIKPAITVKELKSVLDCIFRDEISFGKIVEQLEVKCRESFGFKNSLVLPSHHAAYHLAFLAVGLKVSDEVIIPSLAPLAALDAIGYCKATAKIIDISKNSFHPEVETFIKAITDKTKIVLLPYRFGSFKNYDALYRACEKYQGRIKFIEDISEMPGTSFLGKSVGTNADIALLSLEETMPVTMGKGSILLTNSKSLYQMGNDLRNPTKRSNSSYRVRYDYTITDYQAAMGLEQIDKLKALLEQRKKIAKLYLKGIDRSPFKTFFHYSESDGYGSFPIVSRKNKKEMITYFKKKKIETRAITAYEPLHRMLQLSSIDFPNTERLYEKGILLPIYPHLNQKSIGAIISSFKAMLH